MCDSNVEKNISVPMGTLELKVKTMEEGVRFAWDVGIRDIILV